MSQTVPAVAETFALDEQPLTDFKLTLSQQDQQILAELLNTAQDYVLAAKNARPNLLTPFELLLLTMLMEQHKKVRFLFDQLTYYQQKYYLRQNHPME